jgi:hypothetical protein
LCFQTDNNAGLREEFAVTRIDNGAAAGNDHPSLAAARFLQHFALQISEVRFAFFGEYGRHRFAHGSRYCVVAVYVLPSEFLRDPFPYYRFSGKGKTDYDYVIFIHVTALVNLLLSLINPLRLRRFPLFNKEGEFVPVIA